MASSPASASARRRRAKKDNDTELRSEAPTTEGEFSSTAGDMDSETELAAARAKNKDVGARKFWTRVVVGVVMIGGFSLIMYGGHLYAWGLVVVLQTMIFRELVQVRYKEVAEKNIPWFRSVQWMWFFVALWFTYGDSLGAFLETSKMRFVPPVVVHYLRYHTWVSFSMYTFLFVISVLSLKKGLLKYQMGQYTWTIVILGMIVLQMKYVLNNIFTGLFWFFFPCALVIFNDCFAFFCGKLFGRKFTKAPFVRLSPNKTWEGFIGAFICTTIFGFFASRVIGSFLWMSCPLESLQLIADPLTCTLGSIFQPHVYSTPAALVKFIGHRQVTLMPIQIHSIFFSTFASVVAPFGGFYASAIKRTYGIKDFDSVIPGHGGVMDRMDCQFIMALFTTVYYNTFIRSTVPSVTLVLSLISRLSSEEQREVLHHLQEALMSMT